MRDMMPMFKASLRLVISVLVCMTLIYFYGHQLVDALLPLLRSELNWLDDSYRIVDLVVISQDKDSVIRLDVTLVRYIVYGNHVIAPDPRGHAVVTTLASSVLLPAMCAFGLLVTWPASHFTQYILRVLIGAIFLFLMVPVDVPFVLLGELWELVIAGSSDGSFSPLIFWKDFMQGGGRFALALFFALFTIVISHKLSKSVKVNEWFGWCNDLFGL